MSLRAGIGPESRICDSSLYHAQAVTVISMEGPTNQTGPGRFHTVPTLPQVLRARCARRGQTNWTGFSQGPVGS